MNIKPLISSVNLKENVIIDCGHIAIFFQKITVIHLGDLESPALKK